MEPAKKLHPGIIALIVVVLVGVAATAVIVINQNSRTDTAAEMTQVEDVAESDPATDSVSDEVAGEYKDGTYEATGSYSSPGGRESIALTVTIKDGIITSTSIVTNAKSGDSRVYQTAFAGGYKDLVVGESIDSVSLSRVAGSSLTSNGFNDALDEIKADAKV